MNTKIASGTVHKVPADLRKALVSAPAAHAAWEDLTPLARNEWICWIGSTKKPETRRNHSKGRLTNLKTEYAALAVGMAVFIGRTRL